MRAGLGSNAEAAEALTGLTGSAEYGKVDDDKKSSLLDTFATTPNAATTSYLRGEAGLAAGGSDEELAAAADLKTPDAGHVVLGGVKYTIAEGRLLDKDGKDAGSIDNLGKWSAGEESGDIYDDIHTEANLKEGDESLLSLAWSGAARGRASRIAPTSSGTPASTPGSRRRCSTTTRPAACRTPGASSRSPRRRRSGR